jgi:hypothetical protein
MFVDTILGLHLLVITRALRWRIRWVLGAVKTVLQIGHRLSFSRRAYIWEVRLVTINRLSYGVWHYLPDLRRLLSEFIFTAVQKVTRVIQTVLLYVNARIIRVERSRVRL